MTLNPITASDEEIIKYCQTPRVSPHVVGGSEHGNLVLMLSNQAVVKFGGGVTVDEAANQKFAYEHLDSQIVQVPRVLRFFQDKSLPIWPIGYLVMEFIEGRNLSLYVDEHPQIIQRIIRALIHMGTLTSVTPGPVGGGEPQGYLWSEYGARTTFKTIVDMEDWLNKRLAVCKEKVDLRPCTLRFCHLDLARRNIILRPDRTLCLVDWATAGFYPWVFEICCLQHVCASDPAFFRPLLEGVGSLTENELLTIDLMHKAFAISQRYSLYVANLEKASVSWLIMCFLVRTFPR